MRGKELEQMLAELHQDSYVWALRCCFGKANDAEDVLQNTYLKILEGRAKFQAKSSFKTWLFSVIRFTAADYHRKQQRKRVQLELIQQVTAPIEDQELQQQETALLKQALTKVSPMQRQILHLVFYQNCSIQEAANIMQIPIGTARTHYERAKKQLRKRLVSKQAISDK